jgi:hypothetical protein
LKNNTMTAPTSNTVFNKIHKLSVQQEFFAWRYALHGIGMKAVREAYTNAKRKAPYQNSMAWKLKTNERVMARVEELVAANAAGDIDLEAGPWIHYERFDVGNPVDEGNPIIK